MKRVHLWISGRVQGVFFRVYAQKEAVRLGLSGWVKNLPDGRVEALFEGDDVAVDKMLEWHTLQLDMASNNRVSPNTSKRDERDNHGPPSAKVTSVEIKWAKPTGEFSDFDVLY